MACVMIGRETTRLKKIAQMRFLPILEYKNLICYGDAFDICVMGERAPSS